MNEEECDFQIVCIVLHTSVLFEPMNYELVQNRIDFDRKTNVDNLPFESIRLKLINDYYSAD